MGADFSDPKTARGPFRLGAFFVEPKRNLVTGPKGAVGLEPKIMDVLCALAERPGDVVSRAELIDRIWGVEFGADESLTRAISHLRKVFGDAREEARVIETIPKRGYRLIAPVSAPNLSSEPRTKLAWRWRLIGAAVATAAALSVVAAIFLWPRASPPTQPAERTGIVVVVRPFRTIQPDQTAFANGLAEEISAAIARSPLIRTRTEGAGAQAAPNAMLYALQGDVRRIGSRVRVRAELIDLATGEYVWSESYERPFDANFSAREAIVAAISEELQLPLLRAVKTKLERRPIFSLVPWELTLLVTWVPGAEAQRWPGPPTENSYWLQNRALELDPDYAPAHALFAELAAYHALFDPPSNAPQELARARRHAERAVELAAYDSEVLYQIALYHRFSGDRERAAATLARVLELQPNHPLARIDLAFVQGQCSEASGAAIERLARFERSVSPAHPARWVALSHLSALHLARGEFARAREAAAQSRRIVPQTWTGLTLAAAAAELGDEETAAAVLAEHAVEWPTLNLRYFADQIAPRWCLDGSQTPQAQASFRRLADVIDRM